MNRYCSKNMISYGFPYLTSISKNVSSDSGSLNLGVIFPSEALIGDNHPINPLAGKQPVVV